MAELVPSTLLYGQALQILSEIEDAKEFTADVDDLIRQLATVLVRYEESAGRPLVHYESIAETEPPSSEKSNRFWRAAEGDINLLQQQVDILRAAVSFSHNLVSTEIQNAYDQNARVGSKLKTLQLYSDYSDRSILSFGDSFRSFDFIDVNQVDQFEQPTLFHEGYVTLGRQGEVEDLSVGTGIAIINPSNGFVGNNQEATLSSTGSVVFKAESLNPNNLGHLLDNKPNTWFEYEKYLLTDSQRFTALNYNFEYVEASDTEGGELVDWANGPENGVLQLALEFDLGTLRQMNVIEFTPYGLEENKNYPILVRKVQTSSNRTDWTPLYPTDVYIASEVNLQTAAAARNVVTRKAVWAFTSREVRYVRMYIEQHNPIDSNVGHVYWINRRNNNREERLEGPNPSVSNPMELLDNEVVGDFVQRREIFKGKRWAIGIRDIAFQQTRYVAKSVIVTNPLRVGGVVDRVILEEANIEIPDSFPSTERWVRFFISPDEGENWYPISRIEDAEHDIPEQISFNDPLHESLREGSVKNYLTDKPVTSIRLKIELRRPFENEGVTPVLHGYTLKVKRR